MTDKLKEQLHLFFPDEIFSDEIIEEGLERGDILSHRSKILPFLQTSLLDEKVLEVELNGAPRVYFTRLKDDIPELDEEEQDDEQTELVEPEEYSEGDYLKDLTHLVTYPLEPGVGNMHLQYSQTILLRMFTNTYGVEMCTTFDCKSKVQDVPVLHFNFPKIARIVRNAREFRAKVPEEMNFAATIELGREENALNTIVVDIGIKGLAFSYTKNEQELFVLEQDIPLKLYIDDQLLASMSGRVAHLSKVRKKSGIEHICGVHFDLETRTMAAAIESIVASVQRAHLKSLTEKSEESGLNLIA